MLEGNKHEQKSLLVGSHWKSVEVGGSRWKSVEVVGRGSWYGSKLSEHSPCFAEGQVLTSRPLTELGAKSVIR